MKTRWPLLLVWSLMSLALAGQAYAVGYAATTVYGTVEGEGKWSLSATAEDLETGRALAADFRVDGDRFLCAVTAPDDGRSIAFILRLATREGEEVRRIESLPWGATEVRIVIPDAGKPEIAITSGGGGGPRYDDLTRDSEGSIEGFVRRYNVTVPPETERPDLLARQELSVDAVPLVAGEEDQGRKLVALFFFVSSLAGIILLLKRKK